MSISMSHQTVICCNGNFETDMIGSEGGKILNIYTNQDTTQNDQMLYGNNKGEGIDDWGSGDSGEDLLVPIFSINESSPASIRKEKREGSPPDEDDGGRKRVKFPPQHIKLLEDAFNVDQHPSPDTKEKLQQQLDVSENKIMNRRAKEKREIKKNNKIRQQRKQNNAKPPHFWPADLSFDSPLRHIDPNDQRGDCIQTPITPETEVLEDSYMQNQATRVPVLPSRQENPFTDRNPACSFSNSHHVIPIPNHPTYTSTDSIPMAAIKSLTITQTPFPYRNNIAHANTIILDPQQPWDESIYPAQDLNSCALANYRPLPTTYSGQWLGSPNMQQFVPNNNCSNRDYEFLPSCKIYPTP